MCWIRMTVPFIKSLWLSFFIGLFCKMFEGPCNKVFKYTYFFLKVTRVRPQLTKLLIFSVFWGLKVALWLLSCFWFLLSVIFFLKNTFKTAEFWCVAGLTAISRLLTLPAPCISENCVEIKIKLNFYIHTSLWCLKSPS